MTALAHGAAGPWKWDMLVVIGWLGLLAGGYVTGLRAFAGPRLWVSADSRRGGSADSRHRASVGARGRVSADPRLWASVGPRPRARARPGRRVCGGHRRRVCVGHRRRVCVGHCRRVCVGAYRLGPWRAVCFAGGLLAVAAALLPPLDHLAEESFSAHMAQHMVLVVVAAPLLAAGAPGLLLPLTLPPRWRRRVAALRHRLRSLPLLRLLYLPVTAWLLHTGVLWIWHLPAPYDLALRSEPVHVAEHLCFLGAAWTLWWHLVTRTRHRLSAPAAFGFLFVTMLPAAALGAVLTLAPAPMYPAQAEVSAAEGADPLADQQLAGLIMWVPADVVYFAAMIVVFLVWLNRLARTDDAPRAVGGAVEEAVGAGNGGGPGDAPPAWEVSR